jgi:hypothetical protein
VRRCPIALPLPILSFHVVRPGIAFQLLSFWAEGDEARPEGIGSESGRGRAEEDDASLYNG